MAKRYTDTTIWKKQRWFKKLAPIHKLAWMYVTDTCDHAGILKVDFGEFLDDLGLEEFDMDAFIKACNIEFDKGNGKKIHRDRIKIIKENVIWITGFIKFQYENKDFLVNPAIPAVYSALTILNGYGILEEGLSKGYITLGQPYKKGTLTTKDKDKDMVKDKDIEEDGGLGEEEDLIPGNFNATKIEDPKLWQSEKTSFLQGGDWIFKFCRTKKISVDVFDAEAKEFVEDIELKEDFKDVRALRSHFTNWFNLKYKKHGKKQTATGGGKSAGVDFAITEFLQNSNGGGNS